MVTVYLGDLTYTTITLSNDAFPLAVGYVAAYLKKQYPDIEVELFKYPEDILAAIERRPPDIIGFTNYPWNLNLELAIFEYVKSKNPKTITVMGGPNISYDKDEQLAFLQRTENVLDFYILHEGEKSFKHLVDCGIKTNFDLSELKCQPLKGSIFLHNHGFVETDRIDSDYDLDELPSPYSFNLMDKFFDGRLSPIIETHRGCPHSCTYCHQGHPSFNRVMKHDLDKILFELEYIAANVGNNVHNLMIADSNFGLFPRDIEIAKKISETKSRKNYPSIIFSSTSKNKKQLLVDISKLLQKTGVSMPIWMSAQSMTPKVLKNINRKNIKVEEMLAVQTELSQIGSVTNSELIMCLPGETLKTHIDSIVSLIDLKLDQITCYQLMLVNGSIMNNPETRKSFKFLTRFRILSKNFLDMDVLPRIVETEEIVVGTKDFSFDDYLVARKIHLLISIFYNGAGFKGFFKFMREERLDIKEFLNGLLNKFVEHQKLKPMIESFLQETKEELFTSDKDVRQFYLEDKNFENLLKGGIGANLLHKYTSLAYLEYADELVDVITTALIVILPGKGNFLEQIDDLRKFYRLSFQGFIDDDRDQKITKENFFYNIPRWLSSEKTMECFQFDKVKQLEFHTPENQHKIVEDHFLRLGKNPQTIGKMFASIWISDMQRKPVS